MHWEYSQSTGNMKFKGMQVAKGYSGYRNGKDKPMMEHVRNIGPIPKGEYEIQAPRTSAKTGPYVLPLIPVRHNAHGRTNFQIHGDSIDKPGTASNGCIILNRSIRERIWRSGIRKLIVIN